MGEWAYGRTPFPRNRRYIRPPSPHSQVVTLPDLPSAIALRLSLAFTASLDRHSRDCRLRTTTDGTRCGGIAIPLSLPLTTNSIQQTSSLKPQPLQIRRLLSPPKYCYTTIFTNQQLHLTDVSLTPHIPPSCCHGELLPSPTAESAFYLRQTAVSRGPPIALASELLLYHCRSTNYHICSRQLTYTDMPTKPLLPFDDHLIQSLPPPVTLVRYLQQTALAPRAAERTILLSRT